MSICAGISQGAEYDCEHPLQPGLLPIVMLMNYEDISHITYSGNVIVDITLKSGKRAYMFNQIRQSIDSTYEINETELSTGYIHNVSFQVFDISSAQKVNLQKLSLGKILAITFLINSPGNSNTFFEVHGAGAGLETASLTRVNNSLETSGSYSLAIKTPENLIEAKLPYTFFDTDYATTWDKIASLLTPAVGFPFTFPFSLS